MGCWKSGGFIVDDPEMGPRDLHSMLQKKYSIEGGEEEEEEEEGEI